MDAKTLRAVVAELIGTFMLVFVGAGAVHLIGVANTAAPNVAANVIVAALAHGLILIAIIATYGHFSGAHVNPAVTLGILIAGKIDLVKAVFYWIAQIIGGILAGILLHVVFPGATAGQLGQTLPAAGLDGGGIIVLEAIGTFFLVSTVLQAAVYGRGGNNAPLFIGFTLAAGILAIGPLTGASFNVARTIGPAVAMGNYGQIGAYLVGILAGGALAGLLHSTFFADGAKPDQPAPRSTGSSSGSTSRRR